MCGRARVYVYSCLFAFIFLGILSNVLGALGSACGSGPCVTAYHTAYHNDRMRERVDSQETAVFRAKGGDATFGLLIPPGVEQGGAVDGIAWFGGIEKSQYKSGFQASFVPGMCPCFALTLNFSGR